jgi:hypothetical protein
LAEAGAPSSPRKRPDDGFASAFLQTVRIRDGQGTRDVPKIVAAAQVCLSNALKGDLKSFAKIMERADKFRLLDVVSSPPQITQIRRIIVDPKQPKDESSS